MKQIWILALAFLILQSNISFLAGVAPAKTTTGNLTVKGQWLFSYNGWTAASPAQVNIYDLGPGSQLNLKGTCFTYPNGSFSCGPILNDDGSGNRLDIVVGIFANTSVCHILDSSSNPYFNLTTTVWINCPDGTLDVGALHIRQDQTGAWLLDSWTFGIAGAWYRLYSVVGYNTPTVTVVWPFESWPHYHSGVEIDLPDWGWFFQDVFLHEYAHHVMYTIANYLPSCLENHSITRTSDLSTAWTEGWADFFPLWVLGHTKIVVTNGTHYGEIELENVNWNSSGWDDGGKVEGRVAGALLDIYDSTNDAPPWNYETLSDGIGRLWATMSQVCQEHKSTFEDFWKDWNATYYTHPIGPSSPYNLQDWGSTLMAIFQNSIDYRGLGDVNADGLVSMIDVGAIARKFGSREGDATWDYLYDVWPLNRDGRIDMKDIGLAASKYQTHYC